MGSGKSSAAINYMNSHKDKKFIYITPYLTETERISRECKDLHFIKPSNKLKEYEFSKSKHTTALIKAGYNISTTHQAFKGYTPETLDYIKEQGYTLIIDENVSILEEFNFHPADLQVMVDAGYIKEENGIYSLAKDGYTGVLFKEMMYLLKSRELISIEENSQKLYFWSLPPDLLTSFEEVFILTYIFKSQSLKYFMDIYKIPYTYIGIERTSNGGYKFGDYPGYVPEYVHHLKEKLHILENKKLNDIGSEYYALSKSWYEHKAEGITQLKKNISNYYNNIWRDVPADRKMWGSYNGAMNKIKGKGYTKAFVTFNERATNEYKERDCLVYVANIFMNVNEKQLYAKHGIQVDDDMYALSIMVQWIWRSAIRDGNEVNLYIPSKRMRTLLINWVNSFDEGGVDIAK